MTIIFRIAWLFVTQEAYRIESKYQINSGRLAAEREYARLSRNVIIEYAFSRPLRDRSIGLTPRTRMRKRKIGSLPRIGHLRILQLGACIRESRRGQPLEYNRQTFGPLLAPGTTGSRHLGATKQIDVSLRAVRLLPVFLNSLERESSKVFSEDRAYLVDAISMGDELPQFS